MAGLCQGDNEPAGSLKAIKTASEWERDGIERAERVARVEEVDNACRISSNRRGEELMIACIRTSPQPQRQKGVGPSWADTGQRPGSLSLKRCVGMVCSEAIHLSIFSVIKLRSRKGFSTVNPKVVKSGLRGGQWKGAGYRDNDDSEADSEHQRFTSYDACSRRGAGSYRANREWNNIVAENSNSIARFLLP
ncbi:hypothetical protein ANN_22426 [Periplaneta americana]|uniref:Uncharacterized protein n=1 Tax=Periplaneta americana TaxID=6978 RepID=A0ABQ8S921_PERAM|nr:hypothetical protein ANN_22426 [Periplaneta americana]